MTVVATSITDVVFGLDGVLIEWDGRRPITGQYPQGIADMMFDPCDEWGMEFYLAMLESGWSEERVLASYNKHHGPAIAWVLKMYLDHEKDGFVGMMPGMPELLGDLDAAGIRLWGLANTTRKHLQLALQRFSELRLLRDFVVSSEEKLRLPDPVPVRRAIEHFGIDSGTTLFVNNNEQIVKRIGELGFQSVKFKDADSLRNVIPTVV
ncbi:HAD hydrolase-like protein [Bifidobacterium sp. ESL0798]|uniref:HAD hydrolase-like protein n=1 Tax=Bifidobacterium sp. ESL0798 TaxID=2983235 RepID=UPI0023F66A9F|nr:HAD hydrolase-like protein [Bifidobacterium sp. ESL0798]WEV74444.1 HAD hydrolase-like protein [Bifidobacterium sp. ESL0798]